jgi:hypothetical protein
VIADPPVAPAVKVSVAEPFPAVAVPIAGAAGDVAYVSADGFVSDPLLEGVRITGPASVGVIVKVCPVDELLNVSTTGVESPPPDGVRVTVPVYAAFGVIVNRPDVPLIAPPAGPVKVKVLAGATGVTESDADDDALEP